MQTTKDQDNNAHKLLLPQEKERMLQESRLYINDSQLLIGEGSLALSPKGERTLASISSLNLKGSQSPPRFGPFTPARVPQSILQLVQKKTNANNTSNNSILGEHSHLPFIESSAQELKPAVRSPGSTFSNQNLLQNQSFAMLSEEEKAKKVN